MSFKSAIIVLMVAIAIGYFAGERIKNSDVVKKHFPKIASQVSSFFDVGFTKPGKSSGEEKKSKEVGGNEKLFTKQELWDHYRGGKDSKGLCIAIMGRVYDVSKGARHYGPEGGYSFFAGRDGTKAYATGEFNDKGLTDVLEGVPTESFAQYESWVKFFDKDYKYIGKLIGNFYDETGAPTAALEDAHRLMKEANKLHKLEEEENKKFPRCNSEWSQEKGSRVWCTKKSGGIERDWVGVPRLLHPVGAKSAFCVCIRNTGPPTLEHTTNNDNRGDLDYPYLKEYEGCDPTSVSCNYVK